MRRRYKLPFTALLIFVTIKAFLIYLKLCKYIQPNSNGFFSPAKELDELLEKTTLPSTFMSLKIELKIHFIWTTKPETFTRRQFHVLDSYLHHHPNAEVRIYAKHLPSTHFASYTKMGYNISVITIDKSFLTKISYKCPGQRWMSRVAEWEKGPYFYSHITDYIRFCVLYIEGGLYSDFDAILLKINYLERFHLR